jgi:hypothetical protein
MGGSWQKLFGVSAFQIWELLTLGFIQTNLLSCFNFFFVLPILYFSLVISVSLMFC